MVKVRPYSVICDLYFLSLVDQVDDFEGKAASAMAAVEASGPSIRLPGEGSAKKAAERQAAGTTCLHWSEYWEY